MRSSHRAWYAVCTPGTINDAMARTQDVERSDEYRRALHPVISLYGQVCSLGTQHPPAGCISQSTADVIASCNNGFHRTGHGAKTHQSSSRSLFLRPTIIPSSPPTLLVLAHQHLQCGPNIPLPSLSQGSRWPAAVIALVLRQQRFGRSCPSPPPHRVSLADANLLNSPTLHIDATTHTPL